MEADTNKGGQATSRRNLGRIAHVLVCLLCGWKHALLICFHRWKFSDSDKRQKGKLLVVLLAWNDHSIPW